MQWLIHKFSTTNLLLTTSKQLNDFAKKSHHQKDSHEMDLQYLRVQNYVDTSNVRAWITNITYHGPNTDMDQTKTTTTV